MLLGPYFWVKEALLDFTSPGMTTRAGPFFAALAYSTGLYMALSAISLACLEVSLPAVGDGLSKTGWAWAEPAQARARAMGAMY